MADTSRANPPNVRGLRLNPFAFPSDTDSRFVLLVVSVLGVGMLLHSMLYDRLSLTASYKRAEYDRCLAEATPPGSGASFSELVSLQVLFSSCTTPADAVQAIWILGGLALVLAVAAGLYWTWPARKLRSERLEPLSSEDAPEPLAYLAELCRETGLTHPPHFVWNPLDSSCGGVAFGRRGGYYVALSGGLVSQFFTDRAAFRAVALHELAHLRNGDVDKTYFTVAIWQAFLLAALGPFALGQLASLPSLADLLDLTWRVVPLAALVLLMRNAVLHAREMDADVRASTWDGPSGALRRLLETMPSPSGGSRWSLLRVHPDPSERRLAVDQTDRLLRMGFWDAFGAGCAAGIALPAVVALLNLLLSLATLILGTLIAALLLASLAVGVVGVGAWRTTFVTQALAEPSHGAGRLGLGLGLGLVLGQKLSLADGAYWSYLPSPLGPDPLPVAYLLAGEVVWNTVLLASTFIFLRWIAAGASTWLELSATGPSPRPAYRLGLAVAGGMLAAWLGVLHFLYIAFVGATREGATFLTSLSEALRSPPPPEAIHPALQQAVIVIISLGLLVALLMVVSLWALPLAPWLRRGRVALATGSSWAFLDDGTDWPRLSPLPPLRPEVALRAGLVAGALFWGISALVFAAVWLFPTQSLELLLAGQAQVSGVTAANVQSAWGVFVQLWPVPGQVALAALLQTLVATIVAAWVPRLGALHGLFAACAAGCLMGIGALGLPSLLLAGLGAESWLTQVDLWMTWLFLSTFMIWCPLLALPPAMLVSSIATRFRQRPPISPPHEAVDQADSYHRLEPVR